jgi:aspartyl-tRNA(Asn)/glutamyl-tRNA(Gln) amidotransferase subunit B
MGAPHESAARGYEPVIGLEVHCQLLTRSKIFCSCSTAFGAPPNSQVCPVCLGHPGVLPVLNRRAVELAVVLGLALGSKIREVSVFARKNYFYPDLPKGYQISQYDLPLCDGGSLQIGTGDARRTIGITRLHLEEDAGKMKHAEDGSGRSLVDLNRCGVPLIEIVTEPDLRTPEEAHDFLERLKQLVQYIGVCDGNMEGGSLRCDANVSVRPRGSEALGTKTEIKNLNSFRNVQRALEHEIRRQIAVLESAGRVEGATLLWDATRDRLQVMRTKEEAHDYRYFPEPDLLPLVLAEEWIAAIRGMVPELPEARRARFVREYALPEYDAGVLTATRELAGFYEAAARRSGDAKLASNWVMTELLGAVKGDTERLRNLPLTPERLGDLLALITSGAISGKIAKAVFEEMAVSGGEPGAIIEACGLSQIVDPDAIRALIAEVLAANAPQVVDYLAGHERVLPHFIGQVMKASRGRANPELTNRLLREALEARRE